jgi:chromosome segregation ATPase
MIATMEEPTETTPTRATREPSWSITAAQPEPSPGGHGLIVRLVLTGGRGQLDEYHAAAEDGRKRYHDSLNAARESFRGQLSRCRQAVSEAQRLLDTAKNAEAKAQTSVTGAIGADGDRTAGEEAFRKARLERDVAEMRLSAARDALAAAERDARTELTAKVEQIRADVRKQAAASTASATAAIAAACPELLHLLVAVALRHQADQPLPPHVLELPA